MSNPRKSKDLTVALALLRQVANDPTLDPVRRGALLHAEKELQKLRKTGPLKQAEVRRIVRVVSESLCNAFLDSAEVDEDE